MNEVFKEHLVKKERTPKDTFLRFGVVFLTVLAALAGLLIIPYALLAAVALGILAYFVMQNTDLEYEYALVEKSLDIDKIMAKTRRKHLKSYDLSEADLIAPLTSSRMAYYNNNGQLKTVDYSSGSGNGTVFAIIIKDSGETARVLFEPDAPMAEAMQRMLPSKCFLS